MAGRWATASWVIQSRYLPTVAPMRPATTAPAITAHTERMGQAYRLARQTASFFPAVAASQALVTAFHEAEGHKAQEQRQPECRIGQQRTQHEEQDSRPGAAPVSLEIGMAALRAAPGRCDSRRRRAFLFPTR